MGRDKCLGVRFLCSINILMITFILFMTSSEFVLVSTYMFYLNKYAKQKLDIVYLCKQTIN